MPEEMGIETVGVICGVGVCEMNLQERQVPYPELKEIHHWASSKTIDAAIDL